MLVLTRKIGESIKIGDDIVITMLENGRIGIDAPKTVPIIRTELQDKQPGATDSNP